jgi:hypothetical protein
VNVVRFLSVRSVLFVFPVLAAIATAQQAPAPVPPAAAAQAPRVEVPTFANATCPIMGKAVSMPLFVDTELGRFYLCCKPCNKKVLADVPAAHKTAYPVVQELKNTTCPVSGEAIGDDAIDVTLQGYKLKLCCGGCVAAARTHSQVTLVKATRPAVGDAGNDTCPVSGKPVVANAFAVVDGTIVHLASPKLADEVAKDPAAVLAKAKAIAKAQPGKPKHEHTKAAQGAAGKAGGQ